MTIKELSEHPERASEEDLKTIENAVNQIKEMGKRAKPLMYDVTLERVGVLKRRLLIVTM